MRRQIDRRRDFVNRHFPRLVVWSVKGLIHANGENRQIVEEEGIEMIGVEHHDDVRTSGGELLLLCREQFGGLAIGPVALDEKWKNRGMRHAKPGDDIGHLTFSFASHSLPRGSCATLVGAALGRHT